MDGTTALQVAAKEKHFKSLSVLVKHGGHINAISGRFGSVSKV